MFDNESKLDRLIDSISKNMISYPEMVNLLEFINTHEEQIKGSVNKENIIKPFSNDVFVESSEGFKKPN